MKAETDRQTDRQTDLYENGAVATYINFRRPIALDTFAAKSETEENGVERINDGGAYVCPSKGTEGCAPPPR